MQTRNPGWLLQLPHTLRPICLNQLQNAYARTFASSCRRLAGQPDLYDVVCVGGGPAGLSLLAGLSMYTSNQLS